MYNNKCTKCGAEFETKNPKRVICPGCLYPERKDIALQSFNTNLNQAPTEPEEQKPSQDEKPPIKKSPPGLFVAKESQGPPVRDDRRPYPDDRRPYSDDRRPPFPSRQAGPAGGRGGFGGDRPGYGGDRPNFGGGGRSFGGHGGDRPQGGFGGNRDAGGFGGNRGGFGNRDSGGFGGNRDAGAGGFRRPRPPQQQYDNRQGGGFRRPPMGGGAPFPQRDNRGGGFAPRRPIASNKKLLVSREQVIEIENLYRELLPLPNPDCHETIAEKIGLEANKVFFGINLVRQKLKLTRLPYPKRKLAVSPDQLMAIKNLYTPLLPLPPIGCHKFLSKQLKMDEWRVHVGIGIIRKQMSLPRWNTERADAPEEFKNQPKTEE